MTLWRILILGMMQFLEVHDFLANLMSWAKSPDISLLLDPLYCPENTLVVLGKKWCMCEIQIHGEGCRDAWMHGCRDMGMQGFGMHFCKESGMEG